MIVPNLNFRILLASLFVGYVFLDSVYASSSKNLKFESKFPVAEERRLKRSETKHRISATDTNKRDLNRRQMFCFLGNTPQCMSSPYRTFDGTCNNINNPFWGAAGTPYVRYIPAVYEDGSQRLRGLFRWPSLPNPRIISVAMTNTVVAPRPDNVSLMLMQWGQFIDHDLVNTANDAEGGIYSGSSCCDDFMSPFGFNPSCMPIDVTWDPFYSPLNVTCLPFVRSSDSFCWPQREQKNDATSFMDASQVYGCNEAQAMDLRNPTTPWKLKVSPGNGECTLPTCQFPFLPVRNNSNGTEEFFTGDERVEEQPGLTSMHTAFLRMHNDLGQLYKTKNPSANDTKVYQEIRKIIGAMMQVITYGEFLPLVLGNARMTLSNLLLQNIALANPTFNGYNSSVDASAANVFAAAAFRFGHSLVGNTFTMPNSSTVNLRKSFNKHALTTIAGTFPSDLLRGIVGGLADEMDHILCDAVQNWLLAKPNAHFGSDLYSLNIERGRDHGLPEYIEWVNTCRGLPNAISRFDQLSQLMPQELVDTFRFTYGENIRDIDLYPGALAEYNVPGGVVGQTFACILGEFFFRLKVGDRYYFENPGVFTVAQLKSLRNTKMSNILCRYTDATQLQDNVFLPVSASNPLKSCTDLRTKGIFADISTNW